MSPLPPVEVDLWLLLVYLNVFRIVEVVGFSRRSSCSCSCSCNSSSSSSSSRIGSSRS